MRRNALGILIVLAAIVTSMVLLPREVSLQEVNPRIDPLLPARIERDGEVKVFISLKNLDAPMEEWTVESRTQNATARKDGIFAVLAANDFTLTKQWDRAAAVSAIFHSLAWISSPTTRTLYRSTLLVRPR